MPGKSIHISQDPKIPPFLIREIREKLAYLDEAIAVAQVSSCGSRITLLLHAAVGGDRESKIRGNVGVLVRSMCEGAFEPALRVVEDHTAPAPQTTDPMPELLARREV